MSTEDYTKLSDDELERRKEKGDFAAVLELLSRAQQQIQNLQTQLDSQWDNFASQVENLDISNRRPTRNHELFCTKTINKSSSANTSSNKRYTTSSANKRYTNERNTISSRSRKPDFVCLEKSVSEKT